MSDEEAPEWRRKVFLSKEELAMRLANGVNSKPDYLTASTQYRDKHGHTTKKVNGELDTAETISQITEGQLPLISLITRINKVLRLHYGYVLEGEELPTCAECGHPWPCATYNAAQGNA